MHTNNLILSIMHSTCQLCLLARVAFSCNHAYGKGLQLPIGPFSTCSKTQSTRRSQIIQLLGTSTLSVEQAFAQEHSLLDAINSVNLEHTWVQQAFGNQWDASQSPEHIQLPHRDPSSSVLSTLTGSYPAQVGDCQDWNCGLFCIKHTLYHWAIIQDIWEPNPIYVCGAAAAAMEPQGKQTNVLILWRPSLTSPTTECSAHPFGMAAPGHVEACVTVVG